MPKKPKTTFKRDLHSLAGRELRAGTTALVIMTALLVEAEYWGGIAATANDIAAKDLAKLKRRLKVQ
jgi:hypothetical protein